MEIVSEKNVLNGKIIDKKTLEEMLKLDSTGIYEVIRVINRKPVFLKEHFDRLNNSIKLAGIEYVINYDIFSKDIKSLIDANEFENCNIRLTFDFKEEPNIFMYYIKSFYPPAEYYEKGIHTIFIKRERENPNIKRNAANYREEIDALMAKSGAYEAILVNHDGTISEGSKSNVFFVDNDCLLTANDKDVLLGVTRSKVLEIAQELNIKIVKRDISANEVKNFDAAFITGTSPNILPISSLDDLKFNSCNNEIVNKLRNAYEALIF